MVNKGQTLLAVAALALGIAGLGSAFSARAILSREINANYMRTNPAAVIIRSDIPAEKIGELMSGSLVSNIELRKAVRGRYMRGDNDWIPVYLYSVNDFSAVNIDRIYPDGGGWPVADGEILIERAALSMVAEIEGGELTVCVPGAAPKSLRFSGRAWQPGLPPAWMEGVVYGYVTEETLSDLGYTGNEAELHIELSSKGDRETNSRAAAVIREKIISMGYSVYDVTVPVPGRHPHASQMNALLFMILFLGVMLLVLSCVLTVNLVSVMMQNQLRQIGIMKVLGADAPAVARLYLSSTSLIAVSAGAIGIPAGMLWGFFYADTFSKILNFQIFSYRIPLYVWFVQFAAAMLLPLAVCLYPVLRGVSYTVVRALYDKGIDVRERGSGLPDRLFGKASLFPRPLMLALRNCFRKKERLALTVATLALGGALFIVAMNFRDSLVFTIDRVFGTMRYDISLSLDRQYDEKELSALVSSVEGVNGVYKSGVVSASVLRPDGSTGESVPLRALPIGENLVVPIMQSGTFLGASSENEIVLNHQLLNQEKLFHKIIPGDSLLLLVNAKEYRFRVAGVTKEIAAPPRAYISRKTYDSLFGRTGMARSLLVRVDERSAEGEAAVSKKIEKTLSDNGFFVTDLATTGYYKKIIDDHLFIIFLFLFFVSVLTVIVGGMGLASSLGISVLERTREIGVMRTIGASPHSVFFLVVAESAAVACISWLIALLIAPWLSMLEAHVFGTIFFGAGLDVRVSPAGGFLWLIFSLVVASVSALAPANAALRQSIHRSLRYE